MAKAVLSVTKNDLFKFRAFVIQTFIQHGGFKIKTEFFVYIWLLVVLIQTDQTLLKKKKESGVVALKRQYPV